jgi:16S rRNA (cytosine967-C5)-methyltransferase
VRAAGRGRRLDLALDAAAQGLDARGRGFAMELSYGVMRLRGRLDHLVGRRVDRGLESVHPAVLDVLRVGAYQLLYMGGVPPYAAVSQAVDAVRRVGQKRAAGMVNAVLRRVADDGDGPERFPDPEMDPEGFLATWGSHPRWLVGRWLSRWPFAVVRRLVEENNRVPPLTLVPLDGDVPRAVAALSAAGGRARPVAPGSGAVEVVGLDPRAALAAVPAFVQDPAAAWVGAYASPEPGFRVADLCAAPGGKALYLARSAAYVVAADLSPARCRLLVENRDRTALPLHVVRARAEAPPVTGMDLVVVDAPCTGTGTLRRHPDARWRLRPEDPARLASVQARLLQGSAGAVAPGGLLVYSTCTLEPEENDAVVRGFLAGNPDFTVEPPPPGRFAGPVDADGLLRVLPHVTGTDGSFAARLRRAGPPSATRADRAH